MPKFYNRHREGLTAPGVEKPNIYFDRQKGQGMESLSDRAISRMIEYLRNIGWTEKQITDFIEYIVRQ